MIMNSVGPAAPLGFAHSITRGDQLTTVPDTDLLEEVQLKVYYNNILFRL